MENKKIRTLLILGVWLLLWQAAAIGIGSRILFVGPWEVCRALAAQVRTAEFWRTIGQSSCRIMGGFALAFLCGILLGAGAYRRRLLGEFLEPAVKLLQTVPAASFVILALIWIGSENLSVLICFLVVFPMIYRSTVQGMQAGDKKLLEMAQVFGMSLKNRLLYIYRPALLPYLRSAGRTALGMAWKSGVAAEVIGVPDQSVGEKLYMAKIYLSTADLFAWTLVMILANWLFERVFLRLLDCADVNCG